MCFKVCFLLHYASAKERSIVRSFAQRSRAEDAKPHFDLIELHISRRLCTIEIKTAASTTQAAVLKLRKCKDQPPRPFFVGGTDNQADQAARQRKQLSTLSTLNTLLSTLLNNLQKPAVFTATNLIKDQISFLYLEPGIT